MATQYRSFTVRCWHFDRGQQQFKVECLQTREQVQVPTLEAAVAWIALRSRDTLDEPPTGNGVVGHHA